MGGGNVFPQNHMWAQHCCVRDARLLVVFTQQGVVGRMRGGSSSLICQHPAASGAAGWHILLKRIRYTQDPAREPEASLGEEQGLGKFPRSRCPIWWAYFGHSQDGHGLCWKSDVKSCGLWEERLGGGNCAVLETPGCVLLDLLIPEEIPSIQLCLPRGSLSICFSLQIHQMCERWIHFHLSLMPPWSDPHCRGSSTSGQS